MDSVDMSTHSPQTMSMDFLDKVQADWTMSAESMGSLDIPWTQWIISMDSVDIVQSTRSNTPAGHPLKMSTESMDFLQIGHVNS